MLRGFVINGVTQADPLVRSTLLIGRGECLIKRGEEELGDIWVFGAAGVDLGPCLRLGMVDLPRL